MILYLLVKSYNLVLFAMNMNKKHLSDYEKTRLIYSLESCMIACAIKSDSERRE